MNPDAMDLLESLPSLRFVALSEAEAAELGSGTLAEWREAAEDGWIVSARDYVELLRDGERWRRLADFGWVVARVAAGAAVVALWVIVASLVAGRWG